MTLFERMAAQRGFNLPVRVRAVIRIFVDTSNEEKSTSVPADAGDLNVLIASGMTNEHEVSLSGAHQD